MRPVVLTVLTRLRLLLSIRLWAARRLAEMKQCLPDGPMAHVTDRLWERLERSGV